MTDDAERDELAAQVEAELAKLKVSDVLLHTASAVASLAYRRLADEQQDLDQVRLAIEALKAIVPLLDASVAEDVAGDFRQVLASLQLQYADAVAR